MSSDVVRWTNIQSINKFQSTSNNNRMKGVNRKSVMPSVTISSLCKIIFLLIVINLNLALVLSDEVLDAPGARGHYTPTWAVHVEGGMDAANEVARDHGFVNLGKIVEDIYHFSHNRVSKRSIEPSHHHQNRLTNDNRVRWSKQQRAKSRQKRDLIGIRPFKSSMVQLNDPKWSQMWYLNRGNNLDMNVIPAWREGITGKGVVVTILDDGLESDHPDLEQNYDRKASYDVNSHDEDPMPHYDMTDSNRHGTRCAGEVAATANNSLCAVGIAYGASVGGVRMLDGDVTDAVEARSLSLQPQHIDIYSASWGPDDDGKTVDGPGDLATRAFLEGVSKGRGGKGSIFVWASGNGGREFDNCNCDGYTNSIWTLSISSATEEGLVPWYSEMCSSTLATTYSSGNQGEKQIVTTDLHHSCTVSHTGTSASAPLAAGIVALVLESNRNLTWRDLQHIVVRTAKPANLRDPHWSRNGIGRRVSHSFGYGLMDAAAMVKLARIWKTVPEQQRCEINAPPLDKAIPAKSQIKLQLTVQHCRGVNFLEHVQAKISLTSQRRGDILIFLTSPAGTRVTLLTSRVHDVSRSGFNQWPFMSVHTWGESPHGVWELEIQNEGRLLAQITQWNLLFYGTEQPAQPDDPPPRYNNGPNNKNGLNGENPYGSSSGGSEMEHNSLEFDAGAASGQWRDTHQVGESHVDVQRTAQNEVTGAACTHFSPDNKCLECASYTFLYEGKCYLTCPNGTYIAPETPFGTATESRADDTITNSSSSSRISLQPNKNSNDDNNNNNNSNASKSQQLSLRSTTSTKVDKNGVDDGGDKAAATSKDEAAAAQDDNDDEEEEELFNDLRDILNIKRDVPQKYCYPCHASCFECHGPFDYDCTACDANSIHTVVGPREEYCLPYSPEVPSQRYTDFMNSETVFILIYVLAVVAMVIVFYCIYCVMRQFLQSRHHGSSKQEYFYNPIGVDADDEYRKDKTSVDSKLSQEAAAVAFQ